MKTHISVAVRGALAAAIAVLAQVATPTVGHALPTVANLSVAPAHGQVRSTLTLTYQQTPCTPPQSSTEIRFSWNGAPPAGQPLGFALLDSTCKATLVTASPANAGVGSHEVDGFVPVPQDGYPVAGTLATASYTVDVAPKTNPSPGQPTPAVNTTPQGAGTQASGPSANPSAGATPAPSTPAGTGSGGNGSNNSGSANGGGSSGNQSSGFGPPPYLGTPLGLLSVPLTFGSILLLLLLVIALLLWAMAERRGSAKGAAAASKDQAA